MKKFTKASFSLLFLLFIIQACTKDIVPNPSTINVSQTTLYSQNFDASSAFPGGWSASPSSGWKVKNSNPSYTFNSDSGGYAGASGNNNVAISNPTTNATSYDTLTSNSISTVGFNNITVIYGARNSSNFSANGSALSLAFSVDGGVSWTNLQYSENPGDSEWHLIDMGINIKLPAAAANQPNVQFQWIATLISTTTSSGSYRIDDFQVFGTQM